jgi:preprotein translocase subunit YajC
VEGLASLLPFVLIAVVFWLLLIRPQRRKQLELARTQRELQLGDEVMIGAGIVGRVASVDDEYVGLETSPGVQLRVARGAVVRVLTPEPVEDPEPAPEPRPDEPTDPTDPTAGPTAH